MPCVNKPIVKMSDDAFPYTHTHIFNEANKDH